MPSSERSAAPRFVNRIWLLVSYIVFILTFAIAAIGSTLERHEYKKHKNAAQERVRKSISNVAAVEDVMHIISPDVKIPRYKMKHEGLWITAFLFFIVSLVVLLIVTYRLNMGFLDFYLSFPFRQWQTATLLDTETA